MKTMSRSGKTLLVNERRVRPKEFFGVDAFMFCNWAYTWINGSRMPNGTKVDAWGTMRAIIEEDVLAIGCKWMRAPIELEGWGPPYFDHPDHPNQRGVINLLATPGSKFTLGPAVKKCLRLYTRLAREYDIIIQIPIIWTLKEYVGGKGDPRRKLVIHGKELGDEGVGVWNEHFVANVLRYVTKLKNEGDGEGNNQVGPGSTNLYLSAINEHHVTGQTPNWSHNQMKAICLRARERMGRSELGDLPGELFSLSSSGRYDEYPLKVPQEASHVEQHPPRSGNWDKQGPVMRDVWPTQLIICDESNMLWNAAEKKEWVAKIAKWASLGTTNVKMWQRMHEDLWANDIYSFGHTFPHMSVRWHGPTKSGERVKKAIAELTGATSQPPPAPPPSPTPENPLMGELKFGSKSRWGYAIFQEGLFPALVKGGSEDNAEFDLGEGGSVAEGPGVMRSRWFVTFSKEVEICMLSAFMGTDRGDIVELSVAVYARGGRDNGMKLAPTFSWHKESDLANYDASFSAIVPMVRCRGLSFHVDARCNGESKTPGREGTLTSRPHIGLEWWSSAQA